MTLTHPLWLLAAAFGAAAATTTPAPPITDLALLWGRELDNTFGLYQQGHKVGRIHETQTAGVYVDLSEFLTPTGAGKFALRKMQQELTYNAADGRLETATCSSNLPEVRVRGRRDGAETLFDIQTADGKHTTRLPAITMMELQTPVRLAMHGVVGARQSFHGLQCLRGALMACTAVVKSKERRATLDGTVEAFRVNVTCTGAPDEVFWFDGQGHALEHRIGNILGNLESHPAQADDSP